MSATLECDADLFSDHLTESEALVVDWDNDMSPAPLDSVVSVQADSRYLSVPRGFIRNPLMHDGRRAAEY